MAAKRITHLSADDRKAVGEDARRRTPRSNHRGWRPAGDRPDPVALLEQQNTTREPDLVPVRHGRMVVSPFTFYRGAAKIMAADLKDTPTAYLGDDDAFDRSITQFSERYADQNEQDFQAFVKAVRSGRIDALEGM
jgi:hypothetical protein